MGLAHGFRPDKRATVCAHKLEKDLEMTTDTKPEGGEQPVGKHFTKALLIAANKAAERKGLNRQLVKKWVRSLPDDTTLPIAFTMPHHFAGGEPVETHMRCTFVCPEGELAAVDCPMEIYDSLPGDAQLTPRVPGMLI